MCPRDPSGSDQFEYISDRIREQSQQRINERIRLRRELARADYERRLQRINDIFKAKLSEFTRLVPLRLREEQRRWPIPEDNEYAELVRKQNEYAAENTLVGGQLEEKRHAIVVEENRFIEMAFRYILSMLTEDQIEAIRNTPGTRRARRRVMTGCIREHFLEWLLYEFHFEGECPFCILRIQSEFLAIEHIKKHLFRFTDLAVNSIL